MMFAVMILIFGSSTYTYAQQTNPFELGLTVTDAVFDDARGYVYVSDRSVKKVFFIDLDSGEIAQEFAFDIWPGSMILSTDGATLYVALSQGRFFSGGEDVTGEIVEFDLDTQAIMRQFTITQDPFDIVVSSDGYLYVSSGWEPYIKSFSLETGEEVGQAYLRDRTWIRLHPDEDRIYAADTGVSPSDFEHIAIESGQFLNQWDSPYHGSFRFEGGLHISPDGDYVVSKGGDVFSLAVNQQDDLIYQQSLGFSPIQDVAFDTLNGAYFMLNESSIKYVNAQNFYQLGSLPLVAEGVFIDVVGDSVYAISQAESGQTYLEAFSHPAIGLGNENSPVARLVVMPDTVGTTQTEFVLDASESSDLETSSSALQVRWDWESDGVFDTEFDTTKVVMRRYTLAGEYAITVEVRDDFGFTTAITRELSVSFAPDSGNVPAELNSPFQFPFSVYDIAFDPERPYAYASSQERQEFYVISVMTGLIEQVFTFEFVPGAITITPDGSTLYLALLTREHSSGWYDEEGHVGVIATFDLTGTEPVKTNQYLINEDPYDIVATDDGYLFVASGSGQWTYLRSYLASDGTELDASGSIRERTRIKLHPSQNRIYGADQGLSPSDIERWSISSGQITEYWDSPYHGDYRMSGNLFISPVGDRLITRGGDMFTTTESQATDMMFIDRLWDEATRWNIPFFEDVLYNTEESAIFILMDEEVRYLNLASYEFVASFSIEDNGFSLGIHEDSLFVTRVLDEGSTVIERFLNPMLGAGTNTPPDVQLSVSPDSGSTLTTFVFDASMTTDAETAAQELLFRWDWDNDGTYDTAFDTVRVVEKVFSIAGNRDIKLQVKDHFGFTTTLSQTLSVVFEDDPGMPPEVVNDPYHLPFQFHHVEFDPFRPYAYVSSSEEGKIYFFNLHSGLIEKEFSFDVVPEALFETLDGTMLYAAFEIPQENPYYSEDRRGMIAVFDLEHQTKVNQFWINMAPNDLVATTEGFVYVAGQSVHSYRARDGLLIDTSRFYDRFSSLSLHPNERQIYGADRFVSPSDIYQFGITSSGRFTSSRESRYHGDHRMNGAVYVSPRGDVLVTRGGDVFTSSMTGEEDMEYITSLQETNFNLSTVAFDTLNAVIFTTFDDRIVYYQMDNYFKIGEQATVGNGRFFGTYGDSMYVAIQHSDELALIDPYLHPVLGGKDNTSPVADFSVSPDSGDTQTVFVFDGSISSDSETEVGLLRVRWDWESDGIYDTVFDSVKVIEKRFAFSGKKRITMQVIDALSFSDTITKELDVRFAPDPGMTPDSANTPYELPFEIADAAFEPGTPHLYVSSKTEKKVYLVNLETGLIEKEYAFGLMPESITLDPAGERMYVALLTREHSSGWYDEDGHTGAITVFDLETQTKVDQFMIEADPYDLVATSDGFLYITSGSGQWTRIVSYRIRDRLMVHSYSSIYQETRIKLYPDESRIYGADTRLSPSDIMRFSIESGRFTEHIDSRYHGDHRMDGNVFIKPSGDYLITRGGDVFTTTQDLRSDMEYHASLTERGDYIEAVHFDVSSRIIAAAGRDSLWRFDYDTFSWISGEPLSTPARFMGVYDNGIYVVGGEETTMISNEYQLLRVSTEQEAGIPEEYVLNPNYPNPFKDATNIRMAVPDHGHVTLKIFNITGQEVTTLVDRPLNAGYHLFKWNPSNLGNGVYFAQMTAGNQFSKVIKLVYVK